MTENPTPQPEDEYDYPVAHMTFEADPYNLDSLPTNEEAAEQAIRIMPVYRMAALMVGYDDKQLEEIVRKIPEAHLALLEDIASAIQTEKNHLTLLEKAFCRLSVVMERWANDEDAKAEQ
jgi:hypothetical protein